MKTHLPRNQYRTWCGLRLDLASTAESASAATCLRCLTHPENPKEVRDECDLCGSTERELWLIANKPGHRQCVHCIIDNQGDRIDEVRALIEDLKRSADGIRRRMHYREYDHGQGAAYQEVAERLEALLGEKDEPHAG